MHGSNKHYSIIGIAVGIESMSGGLLFRTRMAVQAADYDYHDFRHSLYHVAWGADNRTRIGNGISLIIFAGIVASFPNAIISTVSLIRAGELHILLMLLVIVVMLVVIGIIVFMERGQRKIPVQYAKRVVGRKVYGGQSTHLPLRVNSAGVIPPIFASSILMFPPLLQGSYPFHGSSLSRQLAPGKIVYTVLYISMIFFSVISIHLLFTTPWI